MGPSLQERHQGPEARQEKDSQSMKRSGAQDLRAAAEGTGVVQSGEEEAQGIPYHSPQLRVVRCWNRLPREDVKIIVPGGVQETFKCGSKEYGIVGKYWWQVDGWTG